MFAATVFQAACGMFDELNHKAIGALLLVSAFCTFLSIFLGLFRMYEPRCIDPFSLLFADRDIGPDNYGQDDEEQARFQQHEVQTDAAVDIPDLPEASLELVQYNPMNTEAV